ncbi:BnaC06g13070D [Brassica napus]|uniref:BnaC06g13070D protein n=1 Tax=Brassica napus TaxID=3708 RepID=A0A078FFG1_BRANA|nr:BnaC06g13070D [Brassica napus]
MNYNYGSSSHVSSSSSSSSDNEYYDDIEKQTPWWINSRSYCYRS